MLKEEKRKQFEDLRYAIETGYYKDYDILPAQLIKEQDIKKAKVQTFGNVSIHHENVIHRINNQKDLAVLVFCSAKNPGGGVLNGAIAQEEELSRHTSWYFQVKDNQEFYLEKGASALNTGNLLYAKKAYVLRNEYGQEIEPISITLIGATAPNLNGLINQGKKVKESEVYKIMEKRIENVLSFAQSRNISTLVLGAWGCGVFGLDSSTVASLFKKKIQENIFAGDIIFSIYGKQDYAIFSNTLSDINQKETNLKKLKKP